MSKSASIPYGKQNIYKEDIDAVVSVLKSDFLTQGPAVSKFESDIAQYCGVKYAIAFSSGTAALHAACAAAGIGHGDEVITTPLTFAASANCVLYCGGTPVFADTHKDAPLINYLDIDKTITSHTKAIIPVDYSGLPADYQEINEIARKHKLVVIADAAHSLGARYKNKKVGQLADMTIFSFHPVKLITSGEGGMIVTNNEKYAKYLQLFRTHGITKDPVDFIHTDSGKWYHEMQFLGYNYRLTDIQAALGSSQIQKADKFIEKRNNIAAWYYEQFSGYDKIRLLELPSDRSTAWHLFPLFLKQKIHIKNKKSIVEVLHRQGIKVQVHFIPIHLHPFYEKLGHYKKGDFPNSEAFYESEISLPIFPGLTKAQVRFIASAVKKCLA